MAPGPARPAGPEFTVVVATYGRGRAIAPTLASIARQSLTDLEVLVVSDGPAHDGLADTVASFDDRFRLHETATRSGSQSGPNNLGTELARGRWLAFLGHDDLWLPHHLADLAGTGRTNPQAHFAVAGCLFLGPSGAEDELTWVSGLFEGDDPAVALEHFFPPSSLAHRRDLPVEVGGWPAPGERPLPVDSAFEVAAARAGCRFVSTGRVSVVKFISSVRYLSYLTDSDVEQGEWLAEMDEPAGMARRVDRHVSVARELGAVMNVRHPNHEGFDVHAAIAAAADVRGLTVARPLPWEGPVWFGCGEEGRGWDWQLPLGPPLLRSRWSGPSPTPKLALPVFRAGEVLVRLHLGSDSAPVLGVDVDGVARPHDQGPGPFGAVVEFRTALRESVSSVATLRTELTGDPARGVRLFGVEVHEPSGGAGLAPGAAAALAGATGTALDAVETARELGARLAGLEAEHLAAREELERLRAERVLTSQHVDNLTDVIDHLRECLALDRAQCAELGAALAQEQQQVHELRRRVRRLRARLPGPGPG